MFDQFQMAAEAVGAKVKRFVSTADATSYVREIAGNGPVCASRLPGDISIALSGIELCEPGAYAGATLCVSFALAGIAATGSLLLTLNDPVERSATALPPVHAVFLRASTIVADLYAIQPLLDEQLAGNGATCLSITTGPSRTADIERVLTIGVHGPKELHILVLEGE